MTRSSSASFQIKGLATKYTTVEWPIGITATFCFSVTADPSGNTFVCLVVYRNRIKATPMNCLLVNLVASDIIVAVLIAVRFIFPLLFMYPKGRTGDVVFLSFMGEAFVRVGALASVFCLVCIALERYLAIKFSYDERKRVTTAKLEHAVVFGWPFAASWNLPLFLYARYDPVGEFCSFQWSTANFAKVHSPVCAAVYDASPISIMSYLYPKLVYKLWFRPSVTSIIVQQRKVRYTKKSAQSTCGHRKRDLPDLLVLVAYVFFSLNAKKLYSPVLTTSIVLVTLNSAINRVLQAGRVTVSGSI